MTRGIQIASIDVPPPGTRVCHYDQLAEGIKGRFPDLVPEDGSRRFVETEDLDAFEACDVVKYTRYFQIESAPDHRACE